MYEPTILAYIWDWTAVQQSLNYLLGGIAVTAEVCAYAALLVIPISLLAAAGRQSRFTLVRRLVQLYLDFFRSTPFLVQLMWWYFALPILTGYTFTSMQAAVLGLAFYIGSYEAEVVRAGILSLEGGQTQAGLALGMTRFQVYRRVVLPQAVVRMIPASMNILIQLIKESAVVSAVSVTDIMWRAESVASRTYRPAEPLTFAGFAYVAVILPLSFVARYLHRRQQATLE